MLINNNIEAYLMGNSLIAQTKRLLRSEQYQWSVRSTGPYSIILTDRRSGIEGEKFAIDYSLLEQEWQNYVLRRNNPRYLVAIYDILQEGEESICANTQKVSVVIEPIPYRFSDLGVLSFPEGMYILRCVLEGYRALTAHAIPFYLLDETAICFNRTGNCKFWINQNLHLSKPHSNRIINEHAFLTGLLEMVQLRLAHVPSLYLQQKQAMETLNCKAVLALVDRFAEEIRCIASINAMEQLPSPISTKYNHSERKENAEQKVSISKFRQHRRRREGKPMDTPLRDDSEKKKLSLSFSKSQGRELSAMLSELKTKQQMLFVSPRKQSAIPSSIIISDYSSRSNSYLRNNCLMPSSNSIHL